MGIPPLIQAQPVEEEEEEEVLQTKESRGSRSTVKPDFQARINTLRGRGRPLPEPVRDFFESRFGYDFGRVRIHSSACANRLARAIASKAFTTGNYIMFGAGEYSPYSNAGRRLLAHELAHVVQQRPDRNRAPMAYSKLGREGCADMVVQRLGDTTQVPPGLPCPIAPNRPSPVENVLFNTSVTTLNAAQKASIEAFITSWRDLGGNSDVRVDGYASHPGGERLNWRLSCERALAVKAELMSPSSGAVAGIPSARITVFAHGETDEFSSSDAGPNQRASISAAVPIPPPSPPPPASTPAFVCGPDVSAQVRNVWGRVQSTFRGWAFREKMHACRMLVQPLIPAEEGGGLAINADAFDTLGLYQDGVEYTRENCYHPPCAIPGSTAPPGADNFDPGHEDPATCSNTVKVGPGCWLAGTPNYGTFGIMMRCCYDWSRPLLLVPGLEWLNRLFTREATAILAGAYKVVRGDDPGPPVAWAVTTWSGGPSATVSGTNRPRCSPTCRISYRGPAFDFVWETSRPRSSVSFDHPTC